MKRNIATNFGERGVGSKVNKVLNFALRNKNSDFYRKKYGNFKIAKLSSYEDLSVIPFLTKKEILGTKLKDRIFVPKKDIAGYAFSGGTTGKRSTAFPRSFAENNRPQYKISHYSEEQIKRTGADRIIVLNPPTSRILFHYIMASGGSVRYIPGDWMNFKITEKIAIKAKINGIIGMTSSVVSLAERLKKTEFDRRLVRFVLIMAEYCSAEKYLYLKEIFPNAYIKSQFGASEFGGAMGYRCDHLEKKYPPSFLHPTPFLVEVVDKNNEIAELGEFGELIHTSIEKKAFPVIRYKSGDIAALNKINCPCGNSYSIDLLGRIGYDYLAFGKYTITTLAVEKVLYKLRPRVSMGRFQVHVYHKKGKFQLKIQIIPIEPPKNYGSISELKKILTRKIEKDLMLSKSEGIRGLIKKGEFLPSKIVILPEQIKGWKAPKIISHLI
jgi:phenylacetate-CoA ligase